MYTDVQEGALGKVALSHLRTRQGATLLCTMCCLLSHDGGSTICDPTDQMSRSTPVANLQLDWAGENEFGVYYYHPQNETIPESQQIEPKVRN